MKRKLISFMTLLLFTILLVGCDFGGNTTLPTTLPPTTTTTEAIETTVAPTTIAPTTVPPTTGTTTTAQNVYFTVEFYDGIGNLLKTEQVLQGSSATAPVAPEKPADAQYTYTFTGWSASFTNVTSDLDLTPVYSTTLNSYEVTFINEDSTVLKTESVNYGSAATAPTTDPTKADDTMYEYTFIGWNVEFDEITSDLLVRAMYERNLHTYAVTFNDADGTEIEVQNIEYGMDALAPQNPYKPADGSNAYEFTGWDTNFTNVTSDLTVTATYTAVSLTTEYTVNFFTESGMLISTESVLIGQSATAPTSPVKNPDQQYTYTFSEWSNSLLNVNSNLDLYPIYTKVLNEYTVTFYDYDGISVLGTDTVPYGTSATPPTNPVKPDDTEYRYTFIGWDSSFNNVQMDLDVFAVYSRTSLSSFEHQMLLNLMVDMFGDKPYDMDETEFLAQLEEDIDDMTLMLDVLTEEELYDDLLIIQQLFLELQYIRTADALHACVDKIATLGFDSNRLVGILFNAMSIGMANDLGYYLDDVTWTQGRIAQKEAEILELEATIATLYSQMSNYCSTTTEATLCQQYVDDWIEVVNLDIDYRNSIYDVEWSEDFDYWEYSDLIYNLDEYYYYTYDEEDIDEANYYLGEFNSLWAELSLEDQALYGPLIDKYELWKDADIQLKYITVWDTLFSTEDSNEEIIAYILEDFLFYGYYDSVNQINYYGYLDYLYEINISYLDILSYERDLEDLEKDIDRTQAFVNYLSDPANEANILALFHMGYDMVDAVIDSIDQDMFDFVYIQIIETMFGSMKLDYYDSYENPFMKLITPENIVFVSENLATMLSAAQSTLSQADFDNLQVVVLGFLEELFTQEGKTEVEKTAMLAVIDSVMDRYINYFQFGLGELISFLFSVDMNKADVILKVAEINPENMMNPLDIPFIAANAFALVFADGSLDIPQIFEYLTEVYFDINTDFNPITTQVNATKAQVVTFITDTLALLDIVKDYHPSFVTPEETENVYELVARAMEIFTMFTEGFDQVDFVVDDLTSQMFGMIFDMIGITEQQPIIDTLLNVFGLTEEDDLLYTMTSIIQYVLGPTRVKDFAGIQEWVANFENFGFTQTELINYASELALIALAQAATLPQYVIDSLAFIDGQITYFEGNITAANLAMDNIDAFIQSAVALLPSAQQVNAQDYWDTYIESMLYLDEYDSAYNTVEYYFGSTFAAEVDALLITMAWEGSGSAYDAAYADYMLIYDELNDWEKELVDELEAMLNIYKPASWYNSDLYDILSVIPECDTFMSTVETQRALYFTQYLIMSDAMDYLEDYFWQRHELMRDYEAAIFLDGFLGTQANLDLVKEVIGIFMDDGQNMIMSMPADSFALLAKLPELFMNNKVDEGPYPELYSDPYSEDEYHEPFEIPFTASEIHGLLHDISDFMKLREESITELEFDQFELLVTTVITELVEFKEEDTSQHADLISMAETVFWKYWNNLDFVVTELTDLIDGLTVQDVQNILDIINMMENHEGNIYMQVVTIAHVINDILDPAVVDIDGLLDIVVEFYFDMEYGIEAYDTVYMAEIQAAWGLYINDLLVDIQGLTTIDPTLPIDPLDFATIYQVQMQVAAIIEIYSPEDILDLLDITYGYSLEELEEMVYNMFNVAWEDVDTQIAELLAVLECSEEELFYILIAVGQALWNMGEPQSIEDIVRIYDALIGLSYTPDTIAHILVNVIMTYLYPNLLAMIDTTELAQAVTDYEDSLITINSNLSTINNYVTTEISLLSDSAIIFDLEAIWENINWIAERQARFDFFYDMYTSGEMYFNYGLWYSLETYVYDYDSESIYDALDELDEDEFYIYDHLVWLLQDLLYYQDSLDEMYYDFDIAYGDVFTITDPYLTYFDFFLDYISGLEYEYYDLYQANYYIEEYGWQIEDIEDSAWLFEAMHQFLSDANNVILFEDVLVILLEGADSMLHNQNIDVVNFMIQYMPNGALFTLENYEISAKLNDLGLLLNSMFATMDQADKDTMEAFAIEMGGILVENATELTVQAEIDAQVANVELIIDTYFSGMFNVPSILGDFLLSIDPVKVDVIYDAAMELDYLSREYENAEWSVAVAKLVKGLIGDDSFDYTLLINSVLPFFYEMSMEVGENPGMGDTITFVSNAILAMDGIIGQAEVVAMIDVDNINVIDQTAITAMNTTIDLFIMYLDSIFDFIEEPVIE